MIVAGEGEREVDIRRRDKLCRRMTWQRSERQLKEWKREGETGKVREKE